MNPYWSGGGVELYCGEALELLPGLKEPGVIIMDPPYSELVHTKSRAGTRALSGNAAHGTATAPANTSRSRGFAFDHLSSELRWGLSGQAGRLASRWVLVFSVVVAKGSRW